MNVGKDAKQQGFDMLQKMACMGNFATSKKGKDF